MRDGWVILSSFGSPSLQSSQQTLQGPILPNSASFTSFPPLLRQSFQSINECLKLYDVGVFHCLDGGKEQALHQLCKFFALQITSRGAAGN